LVVDSYTVWLDAHFSIQSNADSFDSGYVGDSQNGYNFDCHFNAHDQRLLATSISTGQFVQMGDACSNITCPSRDLDMDQKFHVK